MDAATGEYNRPLLTGTLSLVPGYGRMQGIVHRRNDARFEGKPLEKSSRVQQDVDCVMVNPTRAAARVLIDKTAGRASSILHGTQTKSHNAVAVSVAQGRADWGVAIDTVAARYELGFIPLQEEQYDFIVPTSRRASGRSRVPRVARRCASARRAGALGAHAQGASRKVGSSCVRFDRTTLQFDRLESSGMARPSCQARSKAPSPAAAGIAHLRIGLRPFLRRCAQGRFLPARSSAPQSRAARGTAEHGGRRATPAANRRSCL
jgi:molybdate-binding protein